MLERFTDDARQVLVQAQAAARRLGHDFIGCEHLLLARLRALPLLSTVRKRTVTIPLKWQKAMGRLT